MSESIRGNVVRVFTDDSGDYGNPLGIVSSSDATRGREQQIALELNFSETVFIDDVTDGIATIRIFTPAAELPFAGHPSVGTAWWLAKQGTPVTELREVAGGVSVRYDGDSTLIAGRPEWAPEFAWLPLDSVAAVDALDRSEFPAGNNYAWAWVDEPAGAIRSRMFAPALGVPEDEATGAAAVRITALLGRDLQIAQGVGSRILTTLRDDGSVEIGGRTVFEREFTL